MPRSSGNIPPLVQQAQALADQQQFTHSSLPEVGRLLHVLTSHIRAGRIGEIGSGCGYGAAWIVSALQPAVSFFTIELDAGRAASVRQLMAGRANVHALEGDWRALLNHAPFDLLFADGAQAKRNDPEPLIAAVRVGGLILLDDLTPEEHWPPAWRGRPDPVREFWLHDPRLAATELRVTATSAVILATRRDAPSDDPTVA
jgi:predicted O-methyltransferase YrrM